jgi:hypothetical protein
MFYPPTKIHNTQNATVTVRCFFFFSPSRNSLLVPPRVRKELDFLPPRARNPSINCLPAPCLIHAETVEKFVSNRWHRLARVYKGHAQGINFSKIDSPHFPATFAAASGILRGLPPPLMSPRPACSPTAGSASGPAPRRSGSAAPSFLADPTQPSPQTPPMPVRQSTSS